MTGRFASSRRTRRWLPLAVLAVGAWQLASSAGAQGQAAPEPAAAAGETPAPAEAPDLIEPAAREAVKRMVETLTGAQKMSYEYESEYDVVQDDGEMLEFGSRGSATIRRPDRLRGEVWRRDGSHVRYAWDGKTVSIHDDKLNVFATTPRGGDLDSLIDFLRDDVGFRMPVAALFSSDLRQLLIESVVAARHVGKEDLRGVETDHVALRLRTGVDVQLWIRAGGQAFPERISLNFSTADGRPQFRSDFREWNLDPRTRDSLFELKEPKGARRVPFAVHPNRAAAAPAAAQEETR
jgi:hypothetical protein